MTGVPLSAMLTAQFAASPLRAAGLDEPSAAAKAVRFAKAASELSQLAGTGRTAHAFFVPGRVEVLGKHTDYAGGRSIVAAVDKGFCIVAAPREDNTVRIIAAASGEYCEFPLDPQLTPRQGHWANYPMTVARRLAGNFGPQLRGADIAFDSDLPPAAGLSSSSALIIASYFALAAGNDLCDRTQYKANLPSTLALAEYLGTVENGQTFGALVGDRGVGTFGGSEDHTAILCGRGGCLGQYSYCPLRHERDIAMGGGLVFAIAASGVLAEKTGGAMELYNRASQLAAAAAQVWRAASGRSDPHLAAAIAGSPDAPARIRAALAAGGGGFSAADLLRRFEHFYGENEQIIPAAGDALAAGDLAEFGRQVDHSQTQAELLLGNQVPQTIHLARSARMHGAAAASAFGAGFGGSVWAMVPPSQAESFIDTWRCDYAARFPGEAQRAQFFLTRPGPAAMQLA